jgi:hypothetical protein
MPNLFRSSSTLNSTPSSPSSPGSRSNGSVVSSDMAQPRNIDEASETVPLTTVRALLMGSIDPIELAQQILPAKDIPAVVRYNSTPYREKVDLKGHPLVTQEDVLFVGLSYVGFEGERYNVREKLKFDRFFAHYKLHPLTVLDVWNYFNEHDEAFGKRDFKVFLYTLNFLKLCKYIVLFFARAAVFYSCLLLHLFKMKLNMYFPVGGSSVKIHYMIIFGGRLE